MKLSFRRWTFPQRFARILIFFGVPALCLEFIEIPGRRVGHGASLGGARDDRGTVRRHYN